MRRWFVASVLTVKGKVLLVDLSGLAKDSGSVRETWIASHVDERGCQ